MNKEYKAIEYRASRNYSPYETRYCIVSTDTGEVLDDAQGCQSTPTEP